MDIYNIFFEIIRAGLFGGSVSPETKGLLAEEETQIKLIKAAKKHDLAHLLAYCDTKCGLFPQGSAFKSKCETEQLAAVYRYENMDYEKKRICDTLEKAEIPFVLMKGTVIRPYYPEPWLRTSCDIDILVKEPDIEKAKEALVQNAGYAFESKTAHDYHLYSGGGVHLELHYSLLGDDTINKRVDGVLERVWDNLDVVDGFKYCMKMNREMFYYYNFVHLAKHIKFGGCGIKPILDLFILEKSGDYGETCQTLLEEGGLLKLLQVISKLSKVYFSDEEHDEQTKALSDYILSGGVYGNRKNIVAMHRGFSKGKLGYAISRIFPPYDVLKYRYPVLETKKWLFIPFQFRRWFDLVFKGHAKSSLNELKINQRTSADDTEKAARMWHDLGL